MIEANQYAWAAGTLDWYNRRILRKAFATVRVKGLERLAPRNRSLIAAPNHSCWWDGCVDLFLSRVVLGVPSYLMMGETQLAKHRVFSALGVFSVPEERGEGMLASLRHATSLLRRDPAVMWIYPQGQMAPSRAPLEVRRGISLIASRSGVDIIPVAHRYEFLSEDHPEVLVRIGEPLRDSAGDAFTDSLQAAMTELLQKLDHDIAELRLSDYEIVLRGTQSRDRRLDPLTTAASMRRKSL